jgi:hypothetical protein
MTSLSETVISNAYNASFGGLGGAQVSEISRSGGNQFHGNVNYQWNGRVLNANDYFNKLSGSPRAFDNANQYAGAIGGPIKRNKAFFFVNYEGSAGHPAQPRHRLRPRRQLSGTGAGEPGGERPGLRDRGLPEHLQPLQKRPRLLEWNRKHRIQATKLTMVTVVTSFNATAVELHP